MVNSESQKIKEIILKMEDIFNIADVIIRCKKNEITDRKLIAETFDNLRDSGLVKNIGGDYMSVFAKAPKEY